MSVEFDSTVNPDIFYEEYVNKYANLNKIVLCQIDKENKSILVRINIYTLLTGFALSFKGKDIYSKSLVFENNKFVIKNKLVKEAELYEHKFEPMFNYNREHKINEYSVTFELLDNSQGCEDTGILFTNIVLPDEKIFKILVPNTVKVSSNFYTIIISFNGHICIL